MKDAGKPEELDVFCPNCNMVVVARIESVAYGRPTVDSFNAIAPEDSILGLVAYKTAFCVRCESVFLVRAVSTDVAGEFTTPEQHDVLYPREWRPIPEYLPASVRRAYESALSCYQRGVYEPCAIMSRKCLEALCVETGATKGNLKSRLESLAQKGTIDRRLLDWANELRLVGNDAAHDLAVELTKNDARDGIDFVEAILLYVFTLDRKFNEFKTRRRQSISEQASEGS